MDKAQSIHAFWSSFGLAAYDENTVPDDAVMPYITYSVSTGAMDDVLLLNGSLWYRSVTWKDISQKSDEIAETIGEYWLGEVDGGYLWITRGSPFAQRKADEDDTVRRIVINLNAEFLTAF